MKLIFVSKRRPQQRDLLERPYGRFYHLPLALAAQGHEVHLALLSHAGDAPCTLTRDGMSWTSRDVRGMGWTRLLAGLARDTGAPRPDWVIGCSDAWVGVVAARLAHRLGCRLALDAYDDYEAYMPWNFPLHVLWRRALREADITTAAGPQLAALLDRRRSGGPATVVLPMAADPGFVPMPRVTARQLLGLPLDRPIVGYSGGWAANRGTRTLPEAFRHLRERSPDALLALTGRPPDSVLRQAGVVSLGYLVDEKLPVFMNAVDVAAVITTNSRFGRYSYPAKLCEAIACGTKVVATSTPPVAWMLSDQAGALVPPDSPLDLCQGLLTAFRANAAHYAPRPDWAEIATHLSGLLQASGRTTAARLADSR